MKNYFVKDTYMEYQQNLSRQYEIHRKFIVISYEYYASL
jgi:hypothetical protein